MRTSCTNADLLPGRAASVARRWSWLPLLLLLAACDSEEEADITPGEVTVRSSGTAYAQGESIDVTIANGLDQDIIIRACPDGAVMARLQYAPQADAVDWEEEGDPFCSGAREQRIGPGTAQEYGADLQLDSEDYQLQRAYRIRIPYRPAPGADMTSVYSNPFALSGRSRPN